ncbi:MAG: SUMF1/EgtB/PvdO family nonheme iron enzyme [Candidatus Glassbacteria bacterium]
MAQDTGTLLLSVQEFEALGVDPSLGRTVTELLRTELGRSSRLRLLEETGRLYRMQRESARLRELFSERSLRRLGELLESRFVLTGSVSGLDSLISVTARVVNAETGEVLAAETVEHTGGVASLGSSVRSLSRKLLAHFPLTGLVTASRGDTLTADLGLADGVLPGQELTVADFAEKTSGIDTRSRRSARFRVLEALDRSCTLVPAAPRARGIFPVGATVIAAEGPLELLSRAGGRKPTESPLTNEKGFGSVTVETEPPAALAVLAGLDVGRTPVRVSQLAAGRHQLYLYLEGYREVFDSVTVVPETVQDYHFTLNRLTGTLRIFTAQPDVSLRVDTLELSVAGTGSVTLKDFPAGEHSIEARKPGYKTWRKTVAVDFAQDSTLRIELEPYPGSLLVNSVPQQADIFLDGVFTGKKTPWSLVHLDTGAHNIRVSLPGIGSAVDTVEIQPGRDETVELKLREGWFGYEPAGMMLIPAAVMELAGGDSVKVDSFYIDRHEVTNRAYALYLEATGAKPPPQWPGGRIPEGRENHPVVNVTWEEAARFAAWTGKRLPSEDEWEMAAMGIRFRKFPWGDSYRPGTANIWSEGRGGTVEVGSYPDDISVYGIYDMMGNVAEWVDSWTDGNQRYRTFRGGSFYVNQDDPSLASRDGHYPISRNLYVGFRCARDLHVNR